MAGEAHGAVYVDRLFFKMGVDLRLTFLYFMK